MFVTHFDELSPNLDDTGKLPERLPALRQELQLHSSYPESDGSPAWVIVDPLVNAFHRIGWREYQILKSWSASSPAKLIKHVNERTTANIDEEAITLVLQFLQQHQLIELTDKQRKQRITKFLEMKDKRLQQALHHYLFFRIPLVRPAKFLQFISLLFIWCDLPKALTIVISSALMGFILTATNWDLFWATLASTFTPLGMVGYLLALTVTKALHEMGHAIVSTRYGLRVSHMGVIFILGWPLLYTDTNEAWKLTSRRQRLCIDSAGILTELFIAGMATIAWHLTDQADTKQVLFYLATTSWVLTLLLNISPFMRFDGYFILSDWMQFPNLHERSFGTAKVFLRRKLLGWNEPYEETERTSKRVGLISFAFSIWLYRLIVFTGIALAVYAFFFKLLGIALFAVEMYWFVLKPIFKEFIQWKAGWGKRTLPLRKALIMTLLAGLISLIFVPLSVPTTLFGSIQPLNGVSLYAPQAGQIISMPKANADFEQGDVIYKFTQPEIASYDKVTDVRLEAFSDQLKGLGGTLNGEQQRLILEQLSTLTSLEKAANAEKQNKLSIKAPFTGKVLDLPLSYDVGTWVSAGLPMGYFADTSQWQAVFYVEESQIKRLSVNRNITIHTANIEQSAITGRITGIDATPVKQLPFAMLSTRFGGELSVMDDQDGLTPRDTLFRVFVHLQSNTPFVIGTAHGRLHLAPISVFDDVIKPAALKLLQQLNF